MEMGRRIHSARIEAGYRSAKDFAAALGVSESAVYAWEAPSKGKVPHRRTLERIAELTGRSVAYLRDGQQVDAASRLADALERTERELQELKRNMAMKTTENVLPPDHPGVRELAADAELCRNHHVTPTELQELANLVAYRNGQQVTLRTAAEALAMLQSLRMLGPVSEPSSDGGG